MNITLSQIPVGMQTKFFVEETMPECPQIVRWQDNSLTVPCFVREDVNEEGNTVYKFFTAKIEFGGQDIENYDRCLIQSYAQLRHFFYGTQEQQAEMKDDHQWEGHRQAIRTAFPKFAGEVNKSAARFKTIYDEFWTLVDAALTIMHKTREDLPCIPFNAEQMLAFARANGMSEQEIANLTGQFSVISLNVLQNDRNWEELFNEQYE